MVGVAVARLLTNTPMRALTLSMVAIFASASDVDAQSGRNAAWFEILGAGGTWSLNYEHISPTGVLLRFGGTAGGWRNADNVLNGETALIETVGRELHVSLPGGEPDSPVEVGGGVVLGSQWKQHGTLDEKGVYAALVGALGLRSRQSGRGYMWRITFTPLFNFTAVNDYTRKGFQSAGGGSVGWVF